MKNTPYCLSNPKSKENIQKVIDFLKIINEPNRLKILCFLRKQEQCVCDICESLNMPQNLTSHHLKILKNFDLIISKQEGRSIIYSSNKKCIKTHTLLLNNFLISNL